MSLPDMKSFAQKAAVGFTAVATLAGPFSGASADESLQQTSFNSQPTAAALAEQHKDVDIIIQYGNGEHIARLAERSVRLLAEDNIEAVAVPGLDSPDCAALISTYNGEEEARYSLRSILRGALGSEAKFLLRDGKLSHHGASDCPDVSAEPQ